MDVNITIQGVTPLICNRFTDEAAAAASSGQSMTFKGDQSPLELAERKLYKDDAGHLVIPTPNIFRCFMDGGYAHKLGKKQITTKTSSLLCGYVLPKGVVVPLVSKSGWKVDTRPVRIPATGGRILAHRPMFDDWELSIGLEVDSQFPLKLLRQIVDDAGKRVGLGDFRPATKGMYGRFVVTHWTEEPLCPKA